MLLLEKILHTPHTSAECGLSYLYVHLPFLDELSWWLMGRSRSMIRWSLLAGLIYNPARLSAELVDRIYQTARESRAGKAFISFQRSEVLWNGLRSNFTTRLHEITVPILMVHGAQDTAAPLVLLTGLDSVWDAWQVYPAR